MQQILSSRFEYTLDGEYIPLSEKQKEKIREFEVTRKELRVLPCVICDEKSFTLISNIEKHGLLFPTGVCARCGNVQQTQYYAEEDLERFYSSYYRDIYNPLGVEREYLVQQRRGAEIIRFLPKEVLGRVGTVLEIGTGAGGILKNFMDIGKSVRGLDYGREYVEYGISKGIPLEVGGLDNLKESQKYDLIIVSHVLEHLMSPRAFLDKLKSHLSGEGYVYIEVPSIERMNRLINKYDLRHYWQNAHVIHFTIKTLKQLLEMSGYRCIRHDSFIRSLFVADAKMRRNLVNYYDRNLRLLQKIETKYKRYWILIPPLRFGFKIVKFFVPKKLIIGIRYVFGGQPFH